MQHCQYVLVLASINIIIRNNHNVLRHIPVFVARIQFSNDAQQISFNSAKKLARKWC